jgi:Xaa-Pro aminopeptidase
MAYLGDTVPGEILKVWNIVKGARDTALDFVRSKYLQGLPIQGWQVDSVARTYIADRGFGEMFIHRTGHNIGEDDHGTGANLDNLETKDERQLIADTCFSIEPGIYLPDFGVRSEINVVLKTSELIVTGSPVQKEIHLIKAR